MYSYTLVLMVRIKAYSMITYDTETLAFIKDSNTVITHLLMLISWVHNALYILFLKKKEAHAIMNVQWISLFRNGGQRRDNYLRVFGSCSIYFD